MSLQLSCTCLDQLFRLFWLLPIIQEVTMLLRHPGELLAAFFHLAIFCTSVPCRNSYRNFCTIEILREFSYISWWLNTSLSCSEQQARLFLVLSLCIFMSKDLLRSRPSCNFLFCSGNLDDDDDAVQYLWCLQMMSEVGCENCTHAAVAAKKKKLSKGCYAQRDSGGIWTTPEMSGQGLHHWYWDS